MIITAGATDKSVYFYITGNAAHASPGDPITGLLFSDIETGGSASYARQGAVRTDFALITLASASAAHADGGFILVDDTNMPGVYRCDVPDAAFATGVDQVIVDLLVASANNANVAPLLIDITDVDLRDAVRGGMTALPNAAADAAGGLPISDAGGLALDTQLAATNEITAARMGALTDLIDGGRLDLIIDIIAADTTTDIPALLSTITGYLDTEIAAILTDTGELQTDWADGGRLDLILDAASAPTAAAVADAVLDEALSGHVAAGSLGKALADVETDATAILADTNELQGDDVPTLIATAQADLDIITGGAGVVLDTDAITAAKMADNCITSDQWATSATTAIWAQIIETVGSRTAQQALSIILAAVAGVTADSGATIKDAAGTNTRIAATINGSNERTAMTLTPSS